MFERWETSDERGFVTGYLLKEVPATSAAFGRPSRPRDADSPLVTTLCMLVGFILLAGTAAFFWLVATTP